MKALLLNRVSVLLAALAALVVFSGFGSCGYIDPRPPVQECKSDSECPSTFYCAISNTPRTRVVSNTDSEPGGGSLGVRCVDAPAGSGLKTNCMDMDDDDDVRVDPRPTGFCKPRKTPPTPPKTSCTRDSDCANGYSCQRVTTMIGCRDPRAKCAPPTGKGICVKKVKRRKRRRRRQTTCEADSDCRSNQVCKIITTTGCKAEPGGTSTGSAGAARRDGDSDDEPGYMPCKPQRRGVCVNKPKKPTVRYCSKDSQCNSGEICDKLARTQQGGGSTGSSPKCGTQSKCGSADAPVAPMPPLPPGICRPAPKKPDPKRSCVNNSDCKRGEICRLGKQTEPAPAPPKSRNTGTQDDDGDDDECMEPPPAPSGYCAPAPNPTEPAPAPDKAP